MRVAHLRGLFDARIDLAELGLDRAQLFAQVVLALAAAHLLLGLRLDLRLHAGDLELALQQRVHLAQPRERIGDLEHLLRLGEAQLQVRGDQIREPAGLPHVRRDREHLGRQIAERQQLLHARAHRAHQRLALHAPGRLRIGRDRRDLRPERGLVLDERLDARLGEALHQHFDAAVGQAQDAHHHRDRADLMQVVGFRIFDLGVALRGEQQQAVARERVLDRGHRALPRQEERQHHVREHHELPQREHRHLVRHLEVGGHGLGHRSAFRRGRGGT